MSLKTLVQSRLEMTDADIATELNTPSLERRDSTRYTWAGLVLKFGTVTVATMRAALNAVPNVGPLVTEILTSTGVDFSLDETQSMLDTLSPSLGAQAVAGLKNIGRYQVSPYIADGNLGTVTTDQIAACRAEIAADAVRSKLATAINETLQPAITNGATWAELKTLFAGIE